MKPLTTEDLNTILKENHVTKKSYLGTFPACVFPDTGRKTYSFISNTSNHLDFKGEHWVAWFVNGDTIKFFDSFGRSPADSTFHNYFFDFTKTFKKLKFSRRRIQGWTSVACGYFCVHFIYTSCLGFRFQIFLNDYSRSDFEKNDNIVCVFVDSIL